jgi:hypothetical protein
MPTYTYNGSEPLIFGDLHYGVNASVNGVTDRAGEAVVLKSGDVLSTDEAIFHAFLIPHEATIDSAVDAPAAKGKASKGDVPDVTVPEATPTPADSATNK